MSIANAKTWQRNRALELHREFAALAASLQGESSGLMHGLERLAKALNGRVITAGIKSDHRMLKKLRCSPATLYREWHRWQRGGAVPEALLLDYKYIPPRNIRGGGNARRRQVPDALIAEIQRRATLKLGGRDKNGLAPLSVIYKWLRDDFVARKPIPGINYGDFHDGADFPFSYETIVHHAPPKHERALGNRGIAAFRARACHVTMDYSRLRKCELFMLDDVRLDLLCINESSGKAVEVKCYIAMEVASRCIVAFFLKPKDAVTQENVDELVAHMLQVPGFGIGRDYVTHIKFERGTVACSDAAKQTLEGVTHGRLKILRTSMDGGVTWVGAPRDRSSGHAAGKAVIESFMRRLHHSLLHLPGQIGNKWANTPASVGYGSNSPGSLVAESERLAKFALEFGRNGVHRLRLQLPMLYLMQVESAVRDAIDKHNHEPGHNYADHGEFTQAEVAPGVWEEMK